METMLCIFGTLPVSSSALSDAKDPQGLQLDFCRRVRPLRGLCPPNSLRIPHWLRCCLQLRCHSCAGSFRMVLTLLMPEEDPQPIVLSDSEPN